MRTPHALQELLHDPGVNNPKHPKEGGESDAESPVSSPDSIGPEDENTCHARHREFGSVSCDPLNICTDLPLDRFPRGTSLTKTTSQSWKHKHGTCSLTGLSAVDYAASSGTDIDTDII